MEHIKEKTLKIGFEMLEMIGFFKELSMKEAKIH